MRSDNFFRYEYKDGSASFEVVPSAQYSAINSRTLEVDIFDRMGFQVMQVNIPDRKAYEIYRILDNAYRPYDSEGSRVSTVLSTIELPPVQSYRYSAILHTEAEIAELCILRVGIITRQTQNISISFDPNGNSFMDFMGFMYTNFEIPAAVHDVSGTYYYNHLEDYF
jgi:hypothetical protein